MHVGHPARLVCSGHLVVADVHAAGIGDRVIDDEQLAVLTEIDVDARGQQFRWQESRHGNATVSQQA